MKANLLFNILENGIAFLIQSTFHLSLSSNEKSKIFLQAEKELRKNSVSAIRTWNFVHNKNNEEEIEVLKNSGYKYLPRGSAFVWKNLSDENLNPENFLLSRIATQGLV